MKVATPLTSGRHVLAALFLSVLLSCIVSTPPAIASTWTIDQLMQSLAKAPPSQASFTETKTLALLDRPVDSSGTLSYTPPDRLEKRTIRPKPETMIADGGTLTLIRPPKTFTLQLKEQPELAGLIDSIRGTLAGDKTVLERSFRLQLEGPAERWTLTLFPTNEKMAANVHLIRISGTQAEVRTVDVIQTDGDRSTTIITRREAR